MVSRKIGVKISNIKFTKSESKGITANDSADEKVKQAEEYILLIQ